jgi:hypothetical protein
LRVLALSPAATPSLFAVRASPVLARVSRASDAALQQMRRFKKVAAPERLAY